MPDQIMSKAVGIDLGTTNSAVAIMNQTDTDIIIHKDANSGRETTPSCVWKNPRTAEIVVGHMALRRVGTTPVPVRSIKRSMGQQSKVRLTDVDVLPEEISAHIVNEMKQQIQQDATLFNSPSTEWFVDRAVITVPAYFDQPQIEATRTAGEMAGLTVLELLHEPTAAACYYCWKHAREDGIFMVYDFGGGTFDVSILRAKAGAFEVLGISGNTRLGGDDMDTLVAEDLRLRLLKDKYALEFDLKNDAEDQLRFDLLKVLAEGVKKRLSIDFEYLLRDTNTLKDKQGSLVFIDTMYTRAQFEKIIQPLIDKTIPYCFEALENAHKKAGITLADIDEIILAGGSTHIPVVREVVKKTFCSDPKVREPRAKCREPVYEKVDTIVALGAAIRASVTGGIWICNPQRTVRVCLRGAASTGASLSNFGGIVQILNPKIRLHGCSIRLTIPDTDYDEEQVLKENGSFAFTKVPLQQSAENLLSFEIIDANGMVIATVGRPVTHTKVRQRPTGGSSSTAVLSKAISLDVMRAGKIVRKELVPALTTLPTTQIHTFSHPGTTELVILPFYQQRRKIKEVMVKVPLTLPKGTPVPITVTVDGHSLITVEGSIGSIKFETNVKAVQDRSMPSETEIDALQKAFDAAAGYLTPGKKVEETARFQKMKRAFEQACTLNDTQQAVHEFEEMEEMVASLAHYQSPLQPPKDVFGDFVSECYEINQYVAKISGDSDSPHDPAQVRISIDTQREQGEKAFEARDQEAYTEAIKMLESIRMHLIKIAQKILGPSIPKRSETEEANTHLDVARHESEKVEKIAEASKRRDLQDEIKEINQKLDELEQQIARNPHGVIEQTAQLRNRLASMKNVLMGKKQGSGNGKHVEDHSR